MAAEVEKPGFRDRYLRRTRTTRLVYRAIVGVVGTLVIVLGIVLLPLPGPGWLVIFAGLAILASEFAWAERLLDYARDKVLAWTHWVGRQPWGIRLLIGLATLLVVAAAVVGTCRWSGSRSGCPIGPEQLARLVGSVVGVFFSAGTRRAGDWLSGRAPRSHRGGHWFEPSIAHRVLPQFRGGFAVLRTWP